MRKKHEKKRRTPETILNFKPLRKQNTVKEHEMSKSVFTYALYSC